MTRMWALLWAMAAGGGWTVHELPGRLETGETGRKPLPATTPGGVAVFDFDNDGRLDVYLANGGGLPSGPKATNRLLRNLGGMRFADVTATAGVGGTDYDIGAIAGDYDGDGQTDLLVCGLRRLTLYRNRGQGRFEDATARSGIGSGGRWAVGGVWFDMDNDGDLDLFVVHYVRWDAAAEKACVVDGKPDFCHPRYYDPLPNALYRNNGDGTFGDVSARSGIAAHLGKGMAVAAADFDGDGWTDLFVTNDRQFAFYFRNQGDGTFAEQSFEAGVAVPQDGKPVSGMGVDGQDYDNDGRPDLIYTALRDETFPLYRNRGKDFVETTVASRMSVLSRGMAGWGVMFADLDNDGWKDIVAARSDALSAQGGKGALAMEPPAWFRNTGDGRFAAGTGWEALAKAMYRGAVAADLDDDGCVDVVLTALQAAARVLRNPCLAGRHWVKVDVGRAGARVRVGKQWRVAGSAVGYASSYWGPLHFGLGAETRVEGEVHWPDGRRTAFTGEAGRTISVRP